MIVLDTTVASELLFGIRALPAGKYKNRFGRALYELLEQFNHRVLSFDTDAARHDAVLGVAAVTPFATKRADLCLPATT